MNQKRKHSSVNKLAVFYLLACSLLLITSGCKKSFLDVPPQGQTPGQAFWKTQQDATNAVNAMMLTCTNGITLPLHLLRRKYAV